MFSAQKGENELGHTPQIPKVRVVQSSIIVLK